MSSRQWSSKADYDVLMQRALMLKNIRAFFDARDVIEVETPLISNYSSTDPHLDSLRVGFGEQQCYLNTSPEYAMKRLLAGWKRPVYQICKAFRGDELGQFHNPEFTMLEWYRPDFDMWQLMDEMTELVAQLLTKQVKASRNELANSASVSTIKFERLSYQQAFSKHTGINPHHTTSPQCYQFAVKHQVEIPQGLTATDDVDDWLDWLLLQVVLPAFDKHGFTFMYDYPASQCALAKVINNADQVAVAKRFELYFGEIELANGFFELTDAKEQLSRFKQENLLREQAGKATASIDKNLIAALAHGLPACSGVAIGLDRLLMVLTNSSSIEQVLSFPWHSA